MRAEQRPVARLALCCALLLAVPTAGARPPEGHQHGRDGRGAWVARNDDRGQRHESRGNAGEYGAQRGRGQQPTENRRWQDFSPEERRRLEQREQGFRSLPDAEQQRLRAAEERYRSMSPEQREELRRRWEGMSESERDRYRRRIENRDR